MAKNTTSSTKALVSALIGAVVTAFTALQAASSGGVSRAEYIQVGVTLLLALASTAATYFVPNLDKGKVASEVASTADVVADVASALAEQARTYTDKAPESPAEAPAA